MFKASTDLLKTNDPFIKKPANQSAEQISKFLYDGRFVVNGLKTQ